MKISHEGIDYMPCKCGSSETYIAASSKDICCRSCFTRLTPAPALVNPSNSSAIVVAFDGGWIVTVNGETKGEFSKYEDYACTEARKLAHKLNRQR